MPDVAYRDRFPLDRARAWLDDDGRHVWFRHHCAIACDCPDHAVETMLPWPRWHADGPAVQPSLHCAGCGFHEFMRLAQSDGSPDA